MATAVANPLVLIVDDERSLTDVYEMICADEGWRCVCWSAPGSPAEVAALAPSLVLTDLVFAGDCDAGRAFLEALAADSRTARIPVAICTADERLLGESQEPWLARACTRVVKPFDLDDLVAALRRCLGSQRDSPAG